uniref:Uncharacterized protein n=1 Tax=Arundo donax TaxID=35708 RepID=A0A0A9F860_ARUDO
MASFSLCSANARSLDCASMSCNTKHVIGLYPAFLNRSIISSNIL